MRHELVTTRGGRPALAVILAIVASCILAAPARGVELQDLVRLKGSETSKLVGMGLVVGLPGTGDGGKFLPAMRPLAEIIGHLIDPNVVTAELKDAKNVALVALSATIPATGVREGDRVDVYVSAVGAAKSLEGGRLFLIPLKGPLPNSPVYAFAEGAVTVEDQARPTVGVVRGGAQLTADVVVQFIDPQGRVTLVLNNEVANWRVATTIASLINSLSMIDERSPAIARAIDPKNVVVEMPLYERRDPATFIARILSEYVDPALIDTGARVVINERTKTIVFSADVQISPVVITHRGLTISTLTPAAVAQLPPEPEVSNFVAIDPEKRGGAKLSDLIDALKALKVDDADRIAIVKEIHRSGKLHAKLVTE